MRSLGARPVTLGPFPGVGFAASCGKKHHSAGRSRGAIAGGRAASRQSPGLSEPGQHGQQGFWPRSRAHWLRPVWASPRRPRQAPTRLPGSCSKEGSRPRAWCFLAHATGPAPGLQSAGAQKMETFRSLIGSKTSAHPNSMGDRT